VATVDTGSFSGAARRLGLSPSAVSRAVMRLERELGVALLARTTRTLRLTDDGRAFHARCVRILDELGEATDAIARASKTPSGLLRVDAPIALSREVLAPAPPGFSARHPGVRVDLTVRDQFVDPIAEGLDVLVRIGKAGSSSSLIARRLGASRIVHVASPQYLERYGTPRDPTELTRHVCAGYLREGRPAGLDFVGPDGTVVEISMPTKLNANDVGVLRTFALAGAGIVALFDFLARDELAAGTLVEVLPEHPSTTWPIHALYPHNRHLLPKVRAFVDFLVELFAVPEPATRARRRHRSVR